MYDSLAGPNGLACTCIVGILDMSLASSQPQGLSFPQGGLLEWKMFDCGMSRVRRVTLVGRGKSISSSWEAVAGGLMVVVMASSDWVGGMQEMLTWVM